MLYAIINVLYSTHIDRMPVTLLTESDFQARNQKALWVSSNSLLIQSQLLLFHALTPPTGPEYPNTQDDDR